MKAASIIELKKELKEKSPTELLDLCLQLTKFKKENKELLTYLVFEADDEDAYIASVKSVIDESFLNLNPKNFYIITKGVRKILKVVKKYIRYSKKKETEIELLLYFCKKLKFEIPYMNRSKALTGIFERQLEMAKKRIPLLHEDLQYDYNEEVKSII